ncbi:hypothetical protein GCM10010415_37410 [Streptomyces atrovirens]
MFRTRGFRPSDEAAATRPDLPRSAAHARLPPDRHREPAASRNGRPVAAGRGTGGDEDGKAARRHGRRDPGLRTGEWRARPEMGTGTEARQPDVPPAGVSWSHRRRPPPYFPRHFPRPRCTRGAPARPAPVADGVAAGTRPFHRGGWDHKTWPPVPPR